MNNTITTPSAPAYIITGPTSGLGKEAAYALIKAGTLILVGRNPTKLAQLKAEIEQRGGSAHTITCDMADVNSVQEAAKSIIELNLPLAGLVNNAGVQNPANAFTSQGWDMTFATNHLGPFALTDALLPHFQPQANILFIGSATEDPDRKPAQRAGFRGGRYINAESSLHGKWLPDGSVKPGMDAYATSKQCNTAAALALAKENPQLNVNVMEPGIMFNTGLHDNMPLAMVILTKLLTPVLVPFIKVLSTPERAAAIIRRILTSQAPSTGQYFDESGELMMGSTLAHDEQHQRRVVSETRALIRQLLSQAH